MRFLSQYKCVLKVNGEKSGEDLGLVSYQVNGIMEHVPFQSKECDIRNSPRLGDEVLLTCCQVINEWFLIPLSRLMTRWNLIWLK